jgi:hypothetical protein
VIPAAPSGAGVEYGAGTAESDTTSTPYVMSPPGPFSLTFQRGTAPGGFADWYVEQRTGTMTYDGTNGSVTDRQPSCVVGGGSTRIATQPADGSTINLPAPTAGSCFMFYTYVIDVLGQTTVTDTGPVMVDIDQDNDTIMWVEDHDCDDQDPDVGAIADEFC